MKRILILSSGPLCRNPRVFKEACALGFAGYDVTVLTVAYSDVEEAQDAALLAHAPFRKDVVDLVPRPHPVRKLRRFARRASALLARRLLATGLLDAHTLGPVTGLARRARALPWDLLIAHTELPMVIACRLLAEGRPVAVDIEDWHSRDLLASDSRHRPIKLLRTTEAFLMRHALSVTTTSEAMADALQTSYGGPRPIVVRNVFPLQPSTLLPRSTTPPGFFWFSQTTGPGRGLEEFLAAWNLSLQPSRLTLLGNVNPAYQERLIELTSPQRRSALTFSPLIPPGELPDQIARHDIGLSLEPFEPANKNLTASNKIFQYLNAGLAVLATGTAGQREVAAAAPGACEIIDLATPPALAARLDSLLSSPERLHSMAIAARHAAETSLSWEHEAPRLLSSITKALAASPSQ